MDTYMLTQLDLFDDLQSRNLLPTANPVAFVATIWAVIISNNVGHIIGISFKGKRHEFDYAPIFSFYFNTCDQLLAISEFKDTNPLKPPPQIHLEFTIRWSTESGIIYVFQNNGIDAVVFIKEKPRGLHGVGLP